MCVCGGLLGGCSSELSGRLLASCALPPLARLLARNSLRRPATCLQTRVDRVNINNSAAMQALFQGDDWLAQLKRA